MTAISLKEYIALLAYLHRSGMTVSGEQVVSSLERMAGQQEELRALARAVRQAWEKIKGEQYASQ